MTTLNLIYQSCNKCGCKGLCKATKQKMSAEFAKVSETSMC